MVVIRRGDDIIDVLASLFKEGGNVRGEKISQTAMIQSDSGEKKGKIREKETSKRRH